jgi:hypothetical protein
LDRVRQAIGRIAKADMRREMRPHVTGVADGPQAKAGGHGDHWGCVLRATEQDELLGFISTVIQRAERPEMFEAVGAGMAVHAPGERLSACVLVVDNKLVSAYPEARGVDVWPVAISEIVPWSNGVEGQITGECQSTSISFFDTRFYANRRKYKVGETCNFQMNAFAYALGRAADTEFESDIGAKVSLKGAHAYMPANLDNDTADIDDYWFHSPLEAKVTTAELAGKRLRVYPIIVAIPEHFEMHVNLYAADHVASPDLASVNPGDDLEGFLWLQGCLA